LATKHLQNEGITASKLAPQHEINPGVKMEKFHPHHAIVLDGSAEGLFSRTKSNTSQPFRSNHLDQIQYIYRAPMFIQE